jgi:hypothetical protein
MEPIICSPSQSGQQPAIALTVAAKNQEPYLPPFITGETLPCELSQLQAYKTPERVSNHSVISHAALVETVQSAVHYIFRHEQITVHQIRVSHPVMELQDKGGLKLVSHENCNLQPDYYQHMAFLIELPSAVDTLGKEKVHMCVGGVSSMDSPAFLPSWDKRCSSLLAL